MIATAIGYVQALYVAELIKISDKYSRENSTLSQHNDCTSQTAHEKLYPYIDSCFNTMIVLLKPVRVPRTYVLEGC